MSIFETYNSIKGEAFEKVRKESFEAFQAKGIPTPKTEDWRYSDLGLLKSKDLSLIGGLKKFNFKTFTGWPVLVVVNGGWFLNEVPGVEFIPFEGEPNHYTSKGLFESSLERLNLAYAKGGLGVKITKEFKADGLEVLFITDGTNAADFTRNLIFVEEGVKANLFLRTQIRGEGLWTSQITNFVLEKKAELSIYRDFEMGKGSLVTVRDFATLEENSHFRAHALLAGLPSSRYEVEADIRGRGAHAELSGGLLSGDNETTDVLTRIHHASGGTTSNQTFRGVAGAKGKTAFQGRVVVEEDAQKIEAHQNCHNLILERGGEANVKPELLIFADDVVCSHGATVGEVDENALFYMMQRGIPENEARGILVSAFLGEVLESIEDDAIARHFTAKVDAWMAENLR